MRGNLGLAYLSLRIAQGLNEFDAGSVRLVPFIQHAPLIQNPLVQSRVEKTAGIACFQTPECLHCFSGVNGKSPAKQSSAQ